MKEHNHDSPDSKSILSKSILSRRLLLKGSALLCGVHLSGASSLLAFGQDPVAPAQLPAADGKDEKVKPFLDEGYRLFVIEPEDPATFGSAVFGAIPVSRFILHPEIAQNHGGRWQRHHQLEEQHANNGVAHEPDEAAARVAEEPQAQLAPAAEAGPAQARLAPEFPAAPPAMLYLVWTNQENADQIAKIKGVKSITEKEPSDVLETGSAEKAGGILSVMLLPSKGNSQPSNVSFASVEQVVLEFRSALKIVGNDTITFAVVEAKDVEPHEPIGQLIKEQIRIEFTTPKLNEDILEMIKSHPQVMQMKWGGEFAEMVCPGCGMG